MTELREHELREALTDRAALISPQATARLRAVDYHPRSRSRSLRSRSLRSRPALGALGLTGAAAAAGAVVVLGSTAAPAFAGWTAHPTAPRPGQLAGAQQRCQPGAGTPVLTDTRGPYTALINADGSTCIEGNGVTINSSGGGLGSSRVGPGAVELNGAGESDSNAHALTMVNGRIGAGVTGVTVTRSDGSSIQATVKDGWYLAWWPGTERAVSARVASGNATRTQAFPAAPGRPSPACPAGAHCASGYGFAASAGHGARHSSLRIGGSSQRP